MVAHRSDANARKLTLRDGDRLSDTYPERQGEEAASYPMSSLMATRLSKAWQNEL